MSQIEITPELLAQAQRLAAEMKAQAQPIAQRRKPRSCHWL